MERAKMEMRRKIKLQSKTKVLEKKQDQGTRGDHKPAKAF